MTIGVHYNKLAKYTIFFIKISTFSDNLSWFSWTEIIILFYALVQVKVYDHYRYDWLNASYLIGKSISLVVIHQC